MLLKAMGVSAGAAIGTRLAGKSLLGTAYGDIRPPSTSPAVVLLHLSGGFNSLFVSADSFVTAGSFGVTANNFTLLPSATAGVPGVAIDNTWNNALSAWAKSHLAVAGVLHGDFGHGGAQSKDWTFSGSNAGLVLANALGGTGTIKAAMPGGLNISMPTMAVNGISYESINDLQTTAETLGVPFTDPRNRRPNRDIARSGLIRAQTMAQTDLAQNPARLVGMSQGYNAAIATLGSAYNFNLQELQTAYGLQSTQVDDGDLASKLAAAELMTRTGTNVVALTDEFFWDSHGDSDGNNVRNLMTGRVLPSLKTFINRMVDPAGNPNQNVILVVLGDFARSLPGSDHQPNLSVAIFGRNAKPGSTGRVAADVSLPGTTPAPPGMWSYLAALAGLPSTNPFGANQHAALI
jgi:hypothetical protein